MDLENTLKNENNAKKIVFAYFAQFVYFPQYK